jgi:hypothetical protein
MFGKLMCLPQLSRREHEEFVVTVWIGANVRLEICKDMAPRFV